jgi:tetratricopeptide (TPR) repeat protein
MAAFLRADLHEYKGEYYDAIEWYERALSLNQGKDSRIERTYRPLIKCILRTFKPDFRKAEGYALDYLNLRQTVFSLMSLVRVYLRWKYHGEVAGREIPEDIDERLEDALDSLEHHPGGRSTWFEMLAEKAELTGDFESAVDFINKAMELASRSQLVKTGNLELANEVISELEAARNDPDFRGNWQGHLPRLADVYVRALRVANRPPALVNTFAPELPSSDIGRIVGRSKKDPDPFDFW